MMVGVKWEREVCLKIWQISRLGYLQEVLKLEGKFVSFTLHEAKIDRQDLFELSNLVQPSKAPELLVAPRTRV